MGPAKSAVYVISNDSFKNRSLEHPIEPSLVAVEVVTSHRVALAVRLRLLLCDPPGASGCFLPSPPLEGEAARVSVEAFGVNSLRGRPKQR